MSAGRTLEQLRDAVPEHAKDIRVNLQNVLQPGGALSPAQRWGVAVASAVAARHAELRDAVLAEARKEVDAAVIDDALAAAALMAMNNVFYRFKHLIEKPSYRDKPARLRMQRLAKPSASKLDFELFSLAVSAINGCGACMQGHEKTVIEGGLTEDHVVDAMRIASVIAGAAVALESASVSAPAA